MQIVNRPKLTLRDKVSHVANPAKVGSITAILNRSNGTQYGVTWDDLAERWHAYDELTLAPCDKTLGFTADKKS